MRSITSILMIFVTGYFAFKNRYRLMNVFLGSGLIRRIVVGSLMNIPGVRNKMMKTAFSRPAQW